MIGVRKNNNCMITVTRLLTSRRNTPSAASSHEQPRVSSTNGA